MPLARQSEFPPAVAFVRPKTLAFARKPALEARDGARIREERLMAMALGATLRMLGISNVKAGEWLGGESRVRRLLNREKPIRAHDLTKLPPDVADAVMVAFREVLRADAANDNDPG